MILLPLYAEPTQQCMKFTVNCHDFALYLPTHCYTETVYYCPTLCASQSWCIINSRLFKMGKELIIQSKI